MQLRIHVPTSAIEIGGMDDWLHAQEVLYVITYSFRNPIQSPLELMLQTALAV